MTSISSTRLHLPAGALLALALVACGGAGPGATMSAVPASSGAPGTSPAPAATTAPGGGLVGGLSVGELLGTNPQPSPTTWIRVIDAAAPFSFEVPAAWSGHLAYPWVEGSTVGAVLVAGPDPTRLSTGFSVPGVAVGVAANPSGMTGRAYIEADQTYVGKCTASDVQEASEAGATVAFRLWEACGGGQTYVLVLAVVPADGKGLVAILFQGVSPDQLGYLDRIVSSLRAETAQATQGPGATGSGSVSGDTYTIEMEYCQNQHGQGVSGGLIRNDDSLIHAYRIVVAFSDPNGVFLNDTAWTTSDLQPGVTATWQATVPSGLPAVSVTCQITAVTLVR